MYVQKLEKLKKERNAIILAHNYQRPEVQDVADFVGDSLALAIKAKETNADTIVFCGVDFMAESAKILNPDRTVLFPDTNARCPMAAMVDVRSLRHMKRQYGYDIVSYVNTSASVKTVSDICCTSANAVNVVANMQDGIIFTPDENLGNYVKRFVKNRDIILWPGFCPTHMGIDVEDLQYLKKYHPHAEIMAHPECQAEIIDIADTVASTEGMVRHAKASSCREFIVATERELCHRLKKEMPHKKFYPVETAICPTMKKITLEKVVTCLEQMEPQVHLSKSIIRRAQIPLQRMLQLGRG